MKRNVIGFRQEQGNSDFPGITGKRLNVYDHRNLQDGQCVDEGMEILT